ncbi:DUF4142 domain-containing protein [Galbibacter sp.]|jgi:putative membrane protein|uniref:DUF4142 domain-containing protein n=1 Tax=Galbibacter sp. TaxID=2918471 RepID=UPI003A9203EE
MKTIKRNSLVFVCFVFLSASSLTFGQDAPDLMDAEIASVAVVANQIDIDYAKVALKRSKNKDVLDFANRMIEDHFAVIKQAVALVEKLGVNPKDNAVSQSLLSQAEATLTALKEARKRDFDKVYINNEVAFHKAVIDAINGLLIPQTDNAELKDLLQAVVPALEVHLEHAKMTLNKI